MSANQRAKLPKHTHPATEIRGIEGGQYLPSSYPTLEIQNLLQIDNIITIGDSGNAITVTSDGHGGWSETIGVPSGYTRTGNFLDLYVSCVSPEDHTMTLTDPVLCCTQAMFCEKDFQGFGFLGSSSDPQKGAGGGAILMGQGFLGRYCPPIYGLTGTMIHPTDPYGSYPSGTSNPTSGMQTNDYFYRTDRKSLWFYTGSAWTEKYLNVQSPDYDTLFLIRGDTANPANLYLSSINVIGSIYLGGDNCKFGENVVGGVNLIEVNGLPWMFDQAVTCGGGLSVTGDFGVTGGVTIGTESAHIYWQTGTSTHVLETDKPWIFDSSINCNGLSSQLQIGISIATGTAPLSILSTTLCTNLNADMVDGHHWADIPAAQWTAGNVAYVNYGIKISSNTLQFDPTYEPTFNGVIISDGTNSNSININHVGSTYFVESTGLGWQFDQAVTFGAGLSVTGNVGLTGNLTLASNLILTNGDVHINDTYYIDFRYSNYPLYETIGHHFADDVLGFSTHGTGAGFAWYIYNGSAYSKIASMDVGGNLTLAGYLNIGTSGRLYNSAAGVLQVQNWSGQLATLDASNIFVDHLNSASGAGITFFDKVAATTTYPFKTTNNTLDDGSGNLTLASNLILTNGDVHINDTYYIDFRYSNYPLYETIGHHFADDVLGFSTHGTGAGFAWYTYLGSGYTKIASLDASGNLEVTGYLKIDNYLNVANLGTGQTVVGNLNGSTSYYLGNGTYQWAGVVTQVLYATSAPTTTGTAAVITSSGELAKSSSSLKYKQNIHALGDTSWIWNLNPVMFDYKDNGKDYVTSKARVVGKNLIGLIAEEVYKLCPNVVYTAQDGTPDSIMYEGLYAAMLVEIKKLRDRITVIENEIKHP